jgi:hypothetical protein
MELTRSGRRWWILAVLCLSVLLVVVDNTIVNVALPTISRDLKTSTDGLQRVVDAYMLAFVGLLLVAGNLGDRPGRRRVRIVRKAAAACQDELSQVIDRLPPADRGRLTIALRQLAAAAGEGYGTIPGSPVPL